jgi:hypothetical protein
MGVKRAPPKLSSLPKFGTAILLFPQETELGSAWLAVPFGRALGSWTAAGRGYIFAPEVT